MFQHNNKYNLLTINYEIDIINFKKIINNLKKYLNGEITKGELIDIHSERNKLFKLWFYLYEIDINKCHNI
jgi:hypothetical protein